MRQKPVPAGKEQRLTVTTAGSSPEKAGRGRMQVPAMDSGHPISGGVAGTGLDSGATAGADWAGLPLTVFCNNRRAPCALRATGFEPVSIKRQIVTAPARLRFRRGIVLALLIPDSLSKHLQLRLSGFESCRRILGPVFNLSGRFPGHLGQLPRVFQIDFRRPGQFVSKLGRFSLNRRLRFGAFHLFARLVEKQCRVHNWPFDSSPCSEAD